MPHLTSCTFFPLELPCAHAEMAKIPARTLALLEKAAKVALKVRTTKPETSRKLVTVIFTAMEMYKRLRRVRVGTTSPRLSVSVGFGATGVTLDCSISLTLL